MVERRPVLRHDRMVCFDDGADRFQMRAAGIALKNGRVLIQNIAGDTTTFLTGGRMEQGEASAATVVREMEEEFGVTVGLGPMAYLLETFFTDRGMRFHEIGHYYPILTTDVLPYRDSGICHRAYEGTVEMEYRWVRPSPDELAAHNFVPYPLRDRLEGALPDALVHILDDRDR